MQSEGKGLTEDALKGFLRDVSSGEIDVSRTVHMLVHVHPIHGLPIHESVL